MRAETDDLTLADYPPARGNVLLLSCMDLRLIDNITHFMNFDNMENRYDQFILAGSALGAITHPTWQQVFYDHLQAAIDLHDIKDVYILEHRNCGAYEKFLGAEGTFGESAAEQARELESHFKSAQTLTEHIRVWTADHNLKVNVRSFLMDLRGVVTPLATGEPKGKSKSKKKKSR